MEQHQAQALVTEARDYLLSFEEVDNVILERHLDHWMDQAKETNSLPAVYRGLIGSAQNKQMMSNAIGDVGALAGPLLDFDPHQVDAEYEAWDDVFDAIQDSDVETPGEMDKDNPRNSWVQFSKSVKSGASFIAEFDDYENFDTYVQDFYTNEYTRFSLPLLVAERVHGFRFALATDFLKEAGYPEFVKPDVHIIDLFTGLGLADNRDEFDVFVNVIRFAETVDEIPYRIDKLFWLVGSGKFYRDGIEVTTDKQAFIQQAKQEAA